MKLELSSLKSKLARRIFAAFVACALIPVVILAGLSLFQVSRQLEAQADLRLRRAAKSHGLSIYQHLLFGEDELKLVHLRSREERLELHGKFTAIGRRFPDGRYEPILGAPTPPMIDPTPDQRDHLNRGETLMVITGGDPAVICLARHFDAGGHAPGLLVGTVRPAYLWGLENGNILPPLSQFAVSTAAGRPLYRPVDWPAQAGDPGAWDDLDKRARVEFDGAGWRVAQWPLFLKPKFATDGWSLVVLQPEALVLAPIARFKLIFVLVVVLALLMVVALSLYSLRRSLGPIQALKAGARRIARKDFAHRVRVNSRDEFQDLAQSFNDMSGQLGQQFKFLDIQAKIDQATLMGHDFGHIADLTITRLLDDFPLGLVAINRVNGEEPGENEVYWGQADTHQETHHRTMQIEAHDLAHFAPDQPWVKIADRTRLGAYVPAEVLASLGSLTLLPIFTQKHLFAVLSVAGRAASPLPAETLSLIRQIADHLALSWSNVNMIKKLRLMTLGSMQALARTVDAKSSWTAGHSVRVMRLTMNIGRQMELGDDHIERLKQGALLHDIGKIGISSGILDKPGRLTDEEFEMIRSHPAIGDSILAPIPVFRKIVPMVRHHHERWDGKGYPDGLCGEAIGLDARILAVADVYDAIVSDRPYRKGMEPTRAIEIIESESGRQFDPAVVAAFMQTIEERSRLAA